MRDDEAEMARAHYELANQSELNEKTKIPLGWMAAIMVAAFTIFMVLAGAIIWGIRLEARADYYGERLGKAESIQENYGKNQEEIKQALWEVKAMIVQLKDQNGSNPKTSK